MAGKKAAGKKASNNNPKKKSDSVTIAITLAPAQLSYFEECRSIKSEQVGFEVTRKQFLMSVLKGLFEQAEAEPATDQETCETGPVG